MENLSPILEQVIPFRHQLHRHPELSGQEVNTADMVQHFLEASRPDFISEQVGGHGLIFTYDSGQPGPHVMFRAELDALPIEEKSELAYRSHYPGHGHLCGHDGHMAILSGLGMYLSRQKPARGKLSLLFQPAEETGEGAARVIESEAWTTNTPDYLFALHNLPGFPEGELLLKDDVFAAASQGMKSVFRGKTAHAARPEQARSPALALSRCIEDFHQLSQADIHFGDFTLLTVVHAILGTPSFGITPGYGELRATLRSFSNEDMHLLQQWAETQVQRRAEEEKLAFAFDYSEVFPATINHPEAYGLLQQVVGELQLAHRYLDTPFRWSEDFGYYSRDCKCCFFGLGAGEDKPDLHHENFDFADPITETGIRVFSAIAMRLLGG